MSEEKSRSRKKINIALIGMMLVMGTLIVLFNIDMTEEPQYLVDIISGDPENYLEKRTNLKDGSVHYFFNKTDGFGSKSP